MAIENIQYIDSASINVLISSTTIRGTSSWSNNVISASYSSVSLSGSFLTASTNATYYLTLSPVQSGSNAEYTNQNLNFNPNTNLLISNFISCSSITGSHLGSSSYALSGSYSITSSFSSNTLTSSFSTSSFNGSKAWAFVSQSGIILTTTSFGCSVTRSAIGTYPVTFSIARPAATYVTSFNGFSGSNQKTASLGFPINQTVGGFTMSITQVGTPTLAADFSNANIVVFSP